MIIAILLAVIFYGLNQAIFGFFKRRHKFFSFSLMNKLYLYHLFFWLVYYLYVQNSNSDSKGYYYGTRSYQGDWMDLYGTSTTFLDFLAYPFSNLMDLSYEASMMIFGWFGFLGFVFTYLFFRENIPVKIKLFNRIDLLTLLLFLPNMHFWTTSMAKGSVIFLGIMMFIYAIKMPKKRWVLLLLGALITYHVRPHVFMFLVVGAGLGYMSGNKNVSFGQKIAAFGAMIVLLFFIQDSVLALINIEDTSNITQGFTEFTSNRSESLSEEAGSGVDMANYPLPFKLFTFWFRPLFIDHPTALGFIVSTENLLYLILAFKILKKDFFSFIKKSPALVKTSLVVFLSTSFAMTFIMSNLGIIMRQKSMVMYFLFFVIYYYLAKKKYDKIMLVRRNRKSASEVKIPTLS